MSRIELDGVSHRYPEAPSETFAELELVIGSGEAHALLGSSGAGKTTLLNLLSGIQQPTAGRINFDGRDVSRTPPSARNVAQVFQFPVLYESLNVAENLEFPLKTRGVRAAERRRRAKAMAERLGIAALMGRRPGNLSLFERQLVAIGRALVRPELSLVLLDEPLTAVEPSIKWQLRRELKAVQQEIGATMIYVTHDQTEALTFADRISLLHRGRILQTGSARTLFSAPAHEQVGHFIGSPGMNLIPGEIAEGALRLAGRVVAPAAGAEPGPCTIGFRPEWASVAPSGPDGSGLLGTITAARVLGVRRGMPVGILSVDLGVGVVQVRQALAASPGERVGVNVDAGQVVAFREGWRLPGIGAETGRGGGS
jgi:glycerol transport system ATP-binding protein